MKKHEADLIIRFLDNAEKVLSNEKMLDLCVGVNISNSIKTEEDFSVWSSMQSHWDKSYKLWKKELGI